MASTVRFLPLFVPTRTCPGIIRPVMLPQGHLLATRPLTVRPWPVLVASWTHHPLTSARLFRTSFSTKATGPVEFKVDREHEKKLAQEKIQPRPDEVSSGSSIRHVVESSQSSPDVPPMTETIKQDLNSIQEALALKEVPREPYALGLFGTLPYLAMSLSTVYLGWAAQRPYPTSSPAMNSFLISPETAHDWLALLEPIQMGYGAVLISFVGAIHWGMEFMEKTSSPRRTRFRYGLGVLAPIVAWPTLLLPIQFALTGQFLAFVMLYFADSRAAVHGWAPHWYSTYRFVLTFITGSAILVSLIFRSKTATPGADNMSERLAEGMHQRGLVEEAYDEKWAKLEAVAKAEKKKEKEKEKEQQSEKSEKEKGNEKENGKDTESSKTDSASSQAGKGEPQNKTEDKAADKEGDANEGEGNEKTASEKDDSKNQEESK